MTVTNADPTVTLDVPAEARLGEPVQVRATPGDAGTGDDLRCTVTWPGGGRHEGCATTVVLPGVGPHEVRLDAAGEPVGIEEAVTPGASELSWAAGAGRCQWVWKTDRAWAGQTRAPLMRLADGSEHRLVHRFR